MKKLICLIICLLFSSSVFAGYTDFDSLRLKDDGSVSEPSICWLDDTNTGFYRVGADQIGIIIGGVKVGEFDSSGLVDLLGATLESSTSALPEFIIKNTNADATGSMLILNKDSASPAANDIISKIQYKSDDSSGNSTVYGEIRGSVEDPTNTSEDGAVRIYTITSGTLTETAEFASGDTTFESSTASKPVITVKNTNADGNASSVVIQKDSASPAANDVIGDISFTADDASGNATEHARIRAVQVATATANMESKQSFYVIIASSLTEVMTLTTDNISMLVPILCNPVASTPTVGLEDGMLFYNTTTDKFVGRVNGAWEDLH